MNLIDKGITIEELVEVLPESVVFLRDKGIKCIACGEPIWGSLEQAALEKGYTADQVQGLVREMNEMMEKKKER